MARFLATLQQVSATASTKAVAKALGFKLGNRMKLYGAMVEIASDPIIENETVVLVDAIDTKSGERKRVRIPLPILKIAAQPAA